LQTLSDKPLGTTPPPTCIAYAGASEPVLIEDFASISNVLSESKGFVWFDVIDPQAADLATIQEEFHLHPLAIEDAIKAHQRPKIESYDGYWFIVVHAATTDGDALNIHEIAIFAGANFIVTVRDVPPYPLDEVLRRWHARGDALRCDSGALLYEILDTVVDGYSPVAEAYERRIETLETTLFSEQAPTRSMLLQIFSIKKDVQRFRHAVVPMREILAPIMRGEMKLFPQDELPYYRDVYDHAVRVIDEMDAAREIANSALDVHISIASNRQNEVAKQLTIIATIFLPLTYLTGFFGQNFGFLVGHIVNPASFWEFGVGTEVAALLALLGYFKYKKWY